MGCIPERFRKQRCLAMDDRKKEQLKNAVAEALQPGRRGSTAVYVIIAVLLIVFVFQLFRPNVDAAYSDKSIKKNISAAQAVQNASVVDVEHAVDQLDAAANGGTQSEDRQGRYKKLFKNCTVTGDSLTEGLTVYGWLTEEQVYSKIGASVLNSQDLFDKAAGTYPKAAFFAFGMNDMGNYSGNAKAFVKQYESLLKRFHKKSPDSEIYVCSISTPDADAIKNNSSLGDYKKFNKAIRKMCEKKGYTFVDDTSILADHPELYAGDGIHASSEYYPLWLDSMAKAAQL